MVVELSSSEELARLHQMKSSLEESSRTIHKAWRKFNANERAGRAGQAYFHARYRHMIEKVAQEIYDVDLLIATLSKE